MRRVSHSLPGTSGGSIEDMTASIGLGLAALGRPGYINLGHDEDLPPARAIEDLRQRTHELLEQAWKAGVRYFDAARSYGLAEVFLGEWLTPERRDQLTIGSKWGYTYVADWRHDAATHEVKDHSLKTFERQWPETLQALGGPPDFYLVHSLTDDSPALKDKELLDRLRELADSGVRVGLSTSGPRQAETLRKALELNGPFTAVQATWNVLETSAGAALARKPSPTGASPRRPARHPSTSSPVTMGSLRTHSRSAPRSRSRGPTSSSAARPRPSNSRATSPTSPTDRLPSSSSNPTSTGPNAQPCPGSREP